MRKDRRRRNSRDQAPAGPVDHGEELTRTTIFLTENLSRNLDLLAIQEGKSKGELIREVMSRYLREHGFHPDRRPARVNVEYAAAAD